MWAERVVVEAEWRAGFEENREVSAVVLDDGDRVVHPEPAVKDLATPDRFTTDEAKVRGHASTSPRAATES